MQDEHLYLQATREVDDNRQNREIWSKALAMTGGDHFKSKYTYIPLRVAQLLREQGIDPDTVPGLVLPTEADYEMMETGRFDTETSGSTASAASGSTASAAGGSTASTASGSTARAVVGATGAVAAVVAGSASTVSTANNTDTHKSGARASYDSDDAHPLDDLDDTMLVNKNDQQVDTGIWYSETESDAEPEPLTVKSNQRDTTMASSATASANPPVREAAAERGTAGLSSRLDADPTLLPLSEFARLTGMSESDATLEIHRGSIASVTDDGAHYVKRDEINTFVRGRAAEVRANATSDSIEEDSDYAFKWVFAVVLACALAYSLYRFAPALVALYPQLAG